MSCHALRFRYPPTGGRLPLRGLPPLPVLAADTTVCLGRHIFGKPADADADLDTLQGWEPVATRVLTSGQRDAWHVLRKALPDHMVLAQLPLARFIAWRRNVKAQGIYSKIGGSSPILANTEAQAAALAETLADLGQVKVFPCMRYWRPMSDEVAAKVKAFAPDERHDFQQVHQSVHMHRLSHLPIYVLQHLQKLDP